MLVALVIIKLNARADIFKEKTLKNSRASAISIFNQRVVKYERDRVCFQILCSTIYSNKPFKLLKSC